jgi:hypothetical protein
LHRRHVVVHIHSSAACQQGFWILSLAPHTISAT